MFSQSFLLFVSAKAHAGDLAGVVLLLLGPGDRAQGHQALQKAPLLAKPSCWPLGFESLLWLKCSAYAKASALPLSPAPSFNTLILMLVLVLR